jgi:hypothetical protein
MDNELLRVEAKATEIRAPAPSRLLPVRRGGQRLPRRRGAPPSSAVTTSAYFFFGGDTAPESRLRISYNRTSR